MEFDAKKTRMMNILFFFVALAVSGECHGIFRRNRHAAASEAVVASGRPLKLTDRDISSVGRSDFSTSKYNSCFFKNVQVRITIYGGLIFDGTAVLAAADAARGQVQSTDAVEIRFATGEVNSGIELLFRIIVRDPGIISCNANPMSAVVLAIAKLARTGIEALPPRTQDLINLIGAATWSAERITFTGTLNSWIGPLRYVLFEVARGQWPLGAPGQPFYDDAALDGLVHEEEGEEEEEGEAGIGADIRAGAGTQPSMSGPGSSTGAGTGSGTGQGPGRGHRAPPSLHLHLPSGGLPPVSDAWGVWPGAPRGHSSSSGGKFRLPAQSAPGGSAPQASGTSAQGPLEGSTGGSRAIRFRPSGTIGDRWLASLQMAHAICVRTLRLSPSGTQVPTADMVRAPTVEFAGHVLRQAVQAAGVLCSGPTGDGDASASGDSITGAVTSPVDEAICGAFQHIFAQSLIRYSTMLPPRVPPDVLQAGAEARGTRAAEGHVGMRGAAAAAGRRDRRRTSRFGHDQAAGEGLLDEEEEESRRVSRARAAKHAKQAKYQLYQGGVQGLQALGGGGGGGGEGKWGPGTGGDQSRGLSSGGGAGMLVGMGGQWESGEEEGEEEWQLPGARGGKGKGRAKGKGKRKGKGKGKQEGELRRKGAARHRAMGVGGKTLARGGSTATAGQPRGGSSGGFSSWEELFGEDRSAGPAPMAARGHGQAPMQAGIEESGHAAEFATGSGGASGQGVAQRRGTSSGSGDGDGGMGSASAPHQGSVPMEGEREDHDADSEEI